MQQLLIVTLENKRSRLASLPSICSFPHKNSAFHDLRVGLCVRRRRGRKAQVAEEQLGWGGKPPTRKCRQAPRVADVSAWPLWLHTHLDVKRAHVREIRRLDSGTQRLPLLTREPEVLDCSGWNGEREESPAPAPPPHTDPPNKRCTQESRRC